MSQATKIKTGVCVVITDADQKILLGKRKNVLGENTWGLPGGHQKIGESIFECAKREVFAEVNIDLEKMDLIDVTEVVDTGLDYQLVELGYSSNQWQGILELKEHKYCSEWKFFTADDLPKDIFEPHRDIVLKKVKEIKNEGKVEKNLYDLVHPHFKIFIQAYVMNKKGELLMGLRKDPYDKGNWGLPGGHLDVGETLEECVLRELREETGIVAGSASQFAFVEQPMTLSHKHYFQYGFLIRDFDEDAQLINGEPDDVERWEWFNIHNMPPNLAPTQKEIILKFLKFNKITFLKN